MQISHVSSLSSCTRTCRTRRRSHLLTYVWHLFTSHQAVVTNTSLVKMAVNFLNMHIYLRNYRELQSSVTVELIWAQPSDSWRCKWPWVQTYKAIRTQLPTTLTIWRWSTHNISSHKACGENDSGETIYPYIQWGKKHFKTGFLFKRELPSNVSHCDIHTVTLLLGINE